MLNLYIPYTRYHILLSLAIARSNPDKSLRHRIILVDPALQPLCNVFRLHNVTMTSLEYDDRRNNLHTFCVKKHNLHLLTKEIQNIDSINSFYYCCEWHVYTTYLADLIRKTHTAEHFCLIEDGVSTYAEPARKKKNILERIGNYITYGPWHKDFYLPGTMAPQCEVYALLPELLETNLANHVKHRIDLNVLLDSIDDLALSAIVDERNSDYDLNVDALIALDHNSKYTGSENYRHTISQLLYDMSHRFGSVAIKRHPADNSRVNFIPDNVHNVFELDAGLPIEFYYLKFHKTLKLVVGSLSTSLLTAHCMLPKADVLSIISQQNVQSERQAPMIIELFKKLNIGIKIV